MNLGYLFGFIGIVAALVLEGNGKREAAYVAFALTCLAVVFGLVQQ